MLLFLYSEEIFSRDKFNEYNQLLNGWNNNRFISLKDRGWIDVFRKKHLEENLCINFPIKRKGLFCLCIKN